MLKRQDKCKVCQAIVDSPALLERIYKSSYFMGQGESVRSITADVGKFTYESMLNHLKKHQFLSDKDYQNRQLEAIAKESQRQILKRAVHSRQIWDGVLAVGMDKLEKGELQVGTKDLLRAAKDKSDYDLKTTDQQLTYMNMVFHFASGESDANERVKYDRRIVEGKAVSDFDAADDLADDSQRRTDESRSFYESLAGDAFASGTN